MFLLCAEAFLKAIFDMTKAYQFFQNILCRGEGVRFFAHIAYMWTRDKTTNKICFFDLFSCLLYIKSKFV